MADAVTLAERIKAEFDARTQRAAAAEHEQSRLAQERQSRMAEFGNACESLASIWRPRLDEFGRQFGERIKITPTVTPELREAKATFLTNMASMTLTLSAAPDLDVRKIVLDYDLLIVPKYIDHDRNARLEMPLDAIDRDAVGRWIDDRLISCVKAYLAMQDNPLYQERAKVEDPITKARFMPEKAAATLQHGGRTVYFASEASLAEYRRMHEIKPEQPAGAGGTAPAAGRPDPAAPTAKGDAAGAPAADAGSAAKAKA